MSPSFLLSQVQVELERGEVVFRPKDGRLLCLVKDAGAPPPRGANR